MYNYSIIFLLFLFSCKSYSPNYDQGVEPIEPIMNFIDRFLATNESRIYDFLKNEKIIDCEELIDFIDIESEKYNENIKHSKIYQIKKNHRTHRVYMLEYRATLFSILYKNNGKKYDFYLIHMAKAIPWYNFWGNEVLILYQFTKQPNGAYTFDGFFEPLD